MSLFSIGSVLIGLSALFGYINYRFLHLPHTIGLVIIALVASLSVVIADLITPSLQIGEWVIGMLRQIDFNEALMHGMLSFLLFAGALHADLSAFRTRRISIAVMALLGTPISTFAVGFGMWGLADIAGVDLPFIWALVFGALISPTDPVAVLGLFKTVKVSDELQAKMTGESLFNDGIGVVVFTVILGIAMTSADDESATIGHVALLFASEAAGGAALGFAAGYIGYRAMYRIDEPSLEVLITLALVMVTFSVALALHMSGPIAMVVAGLFIGNKGLAYAMSERTRNYVLTFWTLIDEILNSVLFLLIGFEALVLAEIAGYLEAALIAIPITLLARALSVGLPIFVLSRWVTFERGTIPVLIWGGLRGGIAVALALSLPDVEQKPVILGITYAVVLFSIIIQGLTVKPLVRRVIR